MNFPLPLNRHGTSKAAPPSTSPACSMILGHHLTSCAAFSQFRWLAQALVKTKTVSSDRRNASFSRGFRISRSCVITDHSPSFARRSIHSASEISSGNFCLRCSTATPSCAQSASRAFARYGERLLSKKNLKRQALSQNSWPHERPAWAHQTSAQPDPWTLRLRRLGPGYPWAHDRL